jgi:osmotically-inducible protein OsmY
MQMLLCPNCGKLTGFKRALGFGTFFMVLLTAGLWLLVIPFYPARCITCGLTRGSAFAHNFATWYRGLSQGARVFVVVAPLALLFGLGIFNAFENTTQGNPPPPPSSSVPQGSDIFRWPTEGLPAYIADALSTPDLAPISPADGAQELTLGVAGQEQVIPAVNDNDCKGSGGCVWEIKDAANKRELLGDSQGVLHKTQKITNGYYDLLVEDKWELILYEYHGGKYKSTVCYGRSNNLGSSAILTQCQGEDQSTAAPKASMGYPVSEETFLSAYVLANSGRDDLSKDQLIQLGRDEYTMGLQIDTQTLLMGGDLLSTRGRRAMDYLYQHSSATSEQPASTGTAAQRSEESYPGTAPTAPPIQPATAAEARTDGQIEMDVLHALGANSALKDSLISAATAQGEVTLSGTVPNESCRELAELIAKYVPGVARVHNNLTVGIP